MNSHQGEQKSQQLGPWEKSNGHSASPEQPRMISNGHTRVGSYQSKRDKPQPVKAFHGLSKENGKKKQGSTSVGKLKSKRRASS